MKSDHTCFDNMMRRCKTEKSEEGYGTKLKKFMTFCVLQDVAKHDEDFEGTLLKTKEEATDLLKDFIKWMERRGNIASTIKTALTAPQALYDNNRVIYFKKEVIDYIRTNDKKVLAGMTPATTEDVWRMICYTASLRNKAVLHFLASTGMRPGGLVDPPLKVGDLIPLPDISYLFEGGVRNPKYVPNKFEKFERYCYAIEVYNDSKYAYYVFLIPDAAQAVDDYLDERRAAGEKITNDSYLFDIRDHTANIYDYFTDDSLDHMLKGVVKGSKIPRKIVSQKDKISLLTGEPLRKKNGEIIQIIQYDKSITYMFRKRFNGILKLNGDVNSNVAEKLMAHGMKNQLDVTYLRPQLEQVYVEFFKAITDLTPDPFARHNMELAEARVRNEERITLEDKIEEKFKRENELMRRSYEKKFKELEDKINKK